MNNNFFRFNPYILNKETYKALSMHDEPPTLYSLMNSYVNFNKEESEKVKIIDLPSAFRTYLFDFNYPLADNLKADFEENFLSHYMFRRIGFDTYMSFKIHLKNKLNEIMYKYNAMLNEFSNLDFLGINEVHTRTLTNERTESTETSNSSSSSSTNTSTGSSSSTSDNRYSNTPENAISDVQSGTYVTDYTYNQQTGSSNASATGTANGSNTSSADVTGNTEIEETINIHRGDSTDEYLKYQNEINNVYTMMYKELDSLFYGII